MSIYLIIITILSILFWIGITVRVLRFLAFLKEPFLSEHAHLPFLSIVIPARNEERDLEECVMSFIEQDYPHFEIIIVDDASTDRTGSIADSLASRFNNVKVIHLKEFPAGWKGKPYALHRGSLEAKGEYILFSDADMIHKKHSVRTMMSDAIMHNIVFYSALPEFIWKGFFESIFAPAMTVGFAKYSSTSIENLESKKCAAVGGIMIVKRNIYEQLGGHEAIKDSIIDDIDFACHFKKNGHPAYFRFAPNLMKVRMFKGNRDLIRGFAKNLMFAFSSSPYIVFPLILLGIFCFVPGIYSFIYGITAGSTLLVILGIIHYAYVYLSFFLFWNFNKANILYMLLYPLTCIILPVSLLISFHNLVFRKSVVWRGRRIGI